MTFNPPFVLFSSATAFASGAAPTSIEFGSRKEALAEGRRWFANGTAKRELLLCANNPAPKNASDTWRMVGFFAGYPKSYRPIATDQRIKYEGRRRHRGVVVDEPLVEECGHNNQQMRDDSLVVCLDCGYVFEPVAQPVPEGEAQPLVESVPVEQPVTQEYVLSLDPQTAALFRDAFDLACQGHSVTVKIKQPEPAPVVVESNGSAPVESKVG